MSKNVHVANLKNCCNSLHPGYKYVDELTFDKFSYFMKFSIIYPFYRHIFKSEKV